MSEVYKGVTLPVLGDAADISAFRATVDSLVYRKQTRTVRNTVAGAATPTGGASGNGEYLVCPAVSLPLNPFGVGVSYQVSMWVSGRAVVSPGGGYRISARLDGTSIETQAGGQTGASSASVPQPLHASVVVTNPGVAHSVTGVLTALSNITILNDELINFYVELVPAITF